MPTGLLSFGAMLADHQMDRHDLVNVCRRYDERLRGDRFPGENPSKSETQRRLQAGNCIAIANNFHLLLPQIPAQRM